MEAVAVGDEKMNEDGGGGNVNEESVGGGWRVWAGHAGKMLREIRSRGNGFAGVEVEMR